ncbi:MAG: hypothetical protein FGM33_07050 [Candidatus Kapabacteria bacterium]|nr:hypothetical protein [Candidatus Kapabacteria bacterium]
MNLSLTSVSNVVVKVVAMTGDAETIVSDRTLMPGEHKFTYDTAQLSAGWYQILTLVNGVAQTRSVVVIK